MFDQEIQRVLRYVARGLGVRVVGAPGSGRTSVARGVISQLEERGAKVYPIFADPALESVPFAGILSLGLKLRSRPIDILAASDILAEELSRPGLRVLAVDGVESLDHESLSVIDIAHKRLGVPIVVTSSDVPFQSASSATATAVLGRWAQATVSIPPLRYEQVNALVAEILDAPVDVDVAARILAKSGGNLRLAVRIVETALLGERLALRDGRWCLNGPTLMTDHLNGTVEGLLHGLSRDEFRALNTVSLLGTCPVDRLVDAIGAEVLDALEHRGLVSVVPGPDGALLASVFPPVVDEYLREHIGSSRRILRRAMTERFAPPSSSAPAAPPGAVTRMDDAAPSIAALRAEMRGNHAATAQYFRSRLDALVHLHYGTWEAERTLANAVAFLQVYWGAPVDRARVQAVFEHTDTNDGDPADVFFFSLTHSVWIVLSEGDVDKARGIMDRLAADVPGWAAEAEAWALMLEAGYRGEQADIGAALAGLRTQNPSSGVTATVRGLLEVYRFHPEAALDVIDSAPGFETLPRFEPVIRGLALFASGRVDETIAYALERRRDALQAVDQFSLVTQSYVAAVGMLYRGLFDEAEYLMGSAFAVGRPGFLLESFYNAMLRLSSLREGGAPAALGGQAGVGARDVGPLPGVGKGVYELVTRRPESADAFDGEASRLIDENLAHGFVFEAAYSALLCLCLLPGPRVLGMVEAIMSERGVTRYDQLFAFARAVIEGDTRRLEQLVADYVPADDGYQVAMLLRGGATRHRLAGNSRATAAAERAVKDFAAIAGPDARFMALEPERPGPLTVRETEVALLAGHRSNQEIATLLRVSVRTIESHISNALRKTHTTSRAGLSELVRELGEENGSATASPHERVLRPRAADH
ncbi:LuxR C-terminal-related transcriptional regulator [Sinomonas sp. ASV322]|uniref:LuxR C-terminal-related transcriptional regulator n=1 Tax=Sinomonas sp. ASV322 TaxID=3041920 RepID=UPI0027DB2D04|nr:LuxR C-terminal-related transcriptional regulator [Sinomonas sp. ASV322]MDQ4501382.1 LuxR C-terminal-related transcriptional regulator [Sinomonas sp. ASV322]